jgi:hypothetical protein
MRVLPNRAASFAAAALVALAAHAAHAQVSAQPTTPERGRLRLESLEGLGAKASEHVIVDVDASLIKIAAAFLSPDDPEEKEIKELIVGVRGVYVRGYEFKSEGQYAEAELAAIRGQLRAPGWSRMVDVKTSAGGAENVEVYLATDAGRVEGLALVSAEPKKVTVINVVGSVDLEKLRKLRGTLGIPDLDIRIERKTEKKTGKGAKGPARP